MTDNPQLVLGVVTLWNSCIQAFDTIDSGRKYGIDYEIIRVKLEVERIRLLIWGDAVGLNEVAFGRPNTDPRLNQDHIRDRALRLLGCIQHIFEHAQGLQERYGLRPVMVDHEEGPPTQSQLVLDSIFKQASETLRELKKNQQSSTKPNKTIWAIHDKTSFQTMVSEIKGFNDDLETLFPDIKRYISESINDEINKSEDIDALLSLQEATLNDHDNMSTVANVRLEMIKLIAATGRSHISDDQPIISKGYNALPSRETDVDAESQALTEVDEISKQMEEVESYLSKKNEGALKLNLFGPHSYSARVSVQIYCEGMPFDMYWDDREKGFVKLSHASFDLYRRKKFIKKFRRENPSPYTDEDYVLLDVESHPTYENVNPGTVTVEGFAMECWDYEEKFGKPRQNTVMVSYVDMPHVPSRKLLRRIDELGRGADNFGWNTKQEEADLKEFFGDMGVTQSYGPPDESLRIIDIYSLLNRRDIFADFTSKSSIVVELFAPEDEGIGMWNFLWQVILAKELAMRLEHFPDATISGFTSRILAALTIQDLWLRNAAIVLTEGKVSLDGIKKAETPEEHAEADEFNLKGTAALNRGQSQEAVDLYTEAMRIDLSDVVYRSNRCSALLSMEKYDEAWEDAYVATRLDPTCVTAWAHLGFTELKLGNAKRAQDAYQRAIKVAGKDRTNLEQGLADANAKIKADIEAIDNETDATERDALRKKYLDQDWDTVGKTVELHSRIHERQVEGLLLFAERMKWPFINEVRNYAEDVYSKLRRGQTISLDVYDWLFGLTLPGKWMSSKLLAALVLCTPSLSTSLGISYYFDCGLSLPKQSYWRVRTVLGRVLGCLPNVTSLCGWVGPCPPIEFFPPLSEEDKKKPRYIRLKARRIALIESTPDSDDGVIYLGSRNDRYEATRMRPEEDVSAYLTEITGNNHWAMPKPPVREISTCKILSIELQTLPRNTNVAENEVKEQDMYEYRASIIFDMGNNEDPVTYRLYTNPVFVTLPPCHPGPKGPHEVHLREFPMFQRNVWTVDKLKDYTPEDMGEGVMIINATGTGAEALARAWCSELGKNAVIRRAGGPCFVCSVRGASKAGLGVGVLIWVS